MAQRRPRQRGRLVSEFWRSQSDALGGRRAGQAVRYHAYVPRDVGDEEFPLSSTIANAAVNAEQATRELNVDPPGEFNLEALARQLLRAESVASSRIEGLILSHRRLAKAEFSGCHDLTADGVFGNIRALERAVAFASATATLERAHIVEIHRTLLQGTRDEAHGGVIRTEQNWIGGDATSPRNAEFIPPPPRLVPHLLDDLCRFMNREDVPVVIQAAIAHVQFETIHPFADGNGRVGRAIILAILRRRGTAPKYLPPVSLALARNADRYVQGLGSFRQGDPEDWYTVFADAVYNAATGACAFAGQVVELQSRWIEAAGNPRKGSGARNLIALLPSHPIVNVKTAAELLGGSEEQARLAVQRLEAADVLRSTSVGRRNRAFECVGLFDLLDRFERDQGPADRTPHHTNPRPVL